MAASKRLNWDRYGWDTRCSAKTDMMRRLNHNLEWYDWDAERNCFGVSILHPLDYDTIKSDEKFWRLSHICACLGQGALMSNVSFASRSFRSKLWFKRLNHISLNCTTRVPLISVSFRPFWRSHVSYPLYMSIQGQQFILEWFWSTRICSEQLLLADWNFWLDPWWIAIRSNGSFDWISKLQSWWI